MTLPSITISSYDHAESLLATIGEQFTHVISINNPDTKPPRSLPAHQGEHLILYFHDISSLGSQFARFQKPGRQDVERIIKFAEGIDSNSEVLVHCAAGISRSSAAALTIIASKLEPSSTGAQQAVRALFAIKKTIHPNALMVEMADELLGYDTNLVAAYSEAFQGSGGLIWMPPELEDLDLDDLE